MAKRRSKKQKVIQVKVRVNVGHACGNCGERYVNPFKHICRTKTTSGKTRKARKTRPQSDTWKW